MYKYFAIKLKNDFPHFNNYQNEEQESLEEISSLSSLNVIVGSNNSGKSRFMRELIKIKDYNFKIKELDLQKLNQKLNKLQDELKEVAGRHVKGVPFRLSELETLEYQENSDEFRKKQVWKGILSALKKRVKKI